VECFFDDTQTLWVGPLLADSVLGPTSQTKESPTSQAAGNDVSGCTPLRTILGPGA
jgi:hypothetical protein